MNYYAQQNTAKYALPKEDRSPKVRKVRIVSVGKQEIKIREDIYKSRKLFATSLILVVFAMSCVIAFNSLVSSKQIQLDIAQQQLQKAVIVNQTLNTEKAYLDSPVRIIKIAQKQLKMSNPSAVASLTAVNPYSETSRFVISKNSISKQKTIKDKKIQTGGKR